MKTFDFNFAEAVWRDKQIDVAPSQYSTYHHHLLKNWFGLV
ncbi:unnamed protein product [Arabidopsis halleri]